MYVKENGLGMNRIGISVSKRVGNSVVRHRVKRLIKESYRLHENVFNSGLDMVIVARERTREADFYEIEKSDDPDERYYACIVDKNRAGAKPKLLFNLNLAYNRWNELGYLSLKP